MKLIRLDLPYQKYQITCCGCGKSDELDIGDSMGDCPDCGSSRYSIPGTIILYAGVSPFKDAAIE